MKANKGYKIGRDTMDIQINEYYRITSDKYNVTIEERCNRTPTENNPSLLTNWTSVGHYASVEQACAALYNRMVNMGEVRTVHDLMNHCIKCKSDIVRAIQTKVPKYA